MTLRVLVVDDEPPARRKLLAHLGEEPDVEVVGEARDGLEAVEAIRALAPDLVLLDIQMPGLTGLEVVEAVGAEAMPPVIFVTAYDQYAVRAFEVQALDYLLKPFDGQRFKSAFARARGRLDARDDQRRSMAALLEAVAPGPRFLQRLVVRRGTRLRLVPVAEVVRFSARENYVEAVTPTERHLLRETLSGLEARLDPERFARVHRSEIVALDWIQELEPWTHGDYLVRLKNGDEVRLSRRYQKGVLGRGPS